MTSISETQTEKTPTENAALEIRRTLSLLCDPHVGVVELRAWTPDGGILSGFYNDLDELASDAASLDKAGGLEGIFVTLNPVKASLVSRQGNTIHKAGKGELTADENIDSRRWLFIDIDPIRESGINSTIAQHAASANKALAVREWLFEQGWPLPIFASSGNGSHLLYRIDLPNDGEAKKAIKGILELLSDRFSDESMEIDTSVSNASRLTRLYGTTNRKATNVDGHPQRQSQVYWDESPSKPEVVSAEQLRALLPEAKPENRPADLLFGTWEQLNAEARRRLLETRPITVEGEWSHVRAVCHGGQGNKGIFVNMETGAYGCMRGCENNSILRALGLPENPIGENSKTKKLIKKDELVRLADNAELFCNEDGGGAYATVPVNDHFETYAITSGDFRNWLTNEFYKAHGEAVSNQPKQDALNTLAARARFEGRKQRVFIRMGESSGKFYYDLGDESWRVVEVDGDGWRVVDKSPVKFIRPSNFKAQVMPERGGHISELRKLINIEGTRDWTLFVGWLFSCFRASGPYAILSLAGTQDAAKSTTTKMIRLLVDPSNSLVRGHPKEAKDLMVGGKNNFLLAFDNLSHISEELSDSLCRVSTGGGQASREHYTNAEEYLYDVMRPVVMNGIEELATRSDLADRTITVFLPSLRDDQRKDETTLYEEFNNALPRVLGAIFDAVSTAIRELPCTRLENLPRMADVAMFVTAGETAFGWEMGTFASAYDEYRIRAKIDGVEASNIGSAIWELMKAIPEWRGTAAQLLEELRRRLPWGTSTKNFPNSPRAMASALRRLIPNLKAVDIEVELPERVTRVKGVVARTITLTNTNLANFPISIPAAMESVTM